MTIIIEIDKNWTIGIDLFKYVKGIRLRFIAIHVCLKAFDNFMKG